MLGYICKYAPVEVFESMGVQMERIEPDVTILIRRRSGCIRISAALRKACWKRS